MIYVNNAELEKIFGSSSNITFSTVQVEKVIKGFPFESGCLLVRSLRQRKVL